MPFVYFIFMGTLGIILVVCVAHLVAGLHKRKDGYIVGSTVVGVLVLVFMFIFSAAMLFGSVDRGHAGVMTTFGRVNMEDVKREGFYTKAPIVSVHEMSLQRRSVRRASAIEEEGQGNEVVALAKNDVRLTMDVEFPYQLNPSYAPRMFRYIGDDKRYEHELIFKTAAKAVRDGVSEFTDSEAYQSKRFELSARVTELFKQAIVAQLRGLEGFRDLPDEKLHEVIWVQPVQITRVEPPSKILNAIEEKVAADQDLQRQETLTAIAKEIAKRRRNEGTGISNFLDELPAHVSVENAIELLRASADMQRAQALMKAVEEGDLEVIYISGNASVAATAPSK